MIKHQSAFLPEGFKNEIPFIAQEVPELKRPTAHTDKFAFIVSSILQVQKVMKASADEYVALNWEILRDQVGSNYTKPILTALQQMGVIEIKITPHIVEKEDKAGNVERIDCFKHWYRLSKAYRQKKIEYYAITNWHMRRRFFKFNGDKLKGLFKTQPHQRHQFNMLTDLSIHKDAYRQINNECIANQDINRYNSALSSLEIINRMHEAYYQPIYKITMFDFQFTKDASGRVHTPLTNLRSNLRKHILHKGKKVEWVGIDQSNSQVVYGVKLMFEKKHNLLNSTREFISKTISGNIYHDLMEKINFEGTYKEFKALFFEKIWYNELKPYKNKIEARIAQYYPQVIASIRSNKAKMKTNKSPYLKPSKSTGDKQSTYSVEHNGHERFSIKLQSMEARFWQNVVVKMMETKYPDTPFFLVHDSIYVPSDTAESIKAETQTRLDNYTGLKNTPLKFENVG